MNVQITRRTVLSMKMYQNGIVNKTIPLRSLNTCTKTPKREPDTLQTGNIISPRIKMPGCEPARNQFT